MYDAYYNATRHLQNIRIIVNYETANASKVKRWDILSTIVDDVALLQFSSGPFDSFENYLKNLFTVIKIHNSTSLETPCMYINSVWQIGNFEPNCQQDWAKLRRERTRAPTGSFSYINRSVVAMSFTVHSTVFALAISNFWWEEPLIETTRRPSSSERTEAV